MLDPGESCTINVRFAPAGVAGDFTAELVTSSSPGGEDAALLKAAAVPPG